MTQNEDDVFKLTECARGGPCPTTGPPNIFHMTITADLARWEKRLGMI